MATFLQEFDEQVSNLIDKDYPKLAGLSEQKFKDLVEPLKSKLKEQDFIYYQDNGKLSFVIVVKSSLVSVSNMMAKVERLGKSGMEKLYPHSPEEYQPIDNLDVPSTAVYLLLDIDRGKESLNVTPEKAFQTITSQGRSVLTIDEGLAIVTQYPDFLQKNNCFSLLGSRAEDKTVPAIWISENRPKLGWCWNGNPHTWLGSASCGHRLA